MLQIYITLQQSRVTLSMLSTNIISLIYYNNFHIEYENIIC